LSLGARLYNIKIDFVPFRATCQELQLTHLISHRETDHALLVAAPAARAEADDHTLLAVVPAAAAKITVEVNVVPEVL